MSDPLSPLATEFKVRPVVRYLLTRWVPYWNPDPRICGGNSSEKLCEFESEEMAEALCSQLNREEAERVAMVLNPPDTKPYDEAVAKGPESYTGYAVILKAIAEGKRVEWQDKAGEWVYQHPSHTLNEIKGILQAPERYRVKAPD
jgi:hypothetical protein